MRAVVQRVTSARVVVADEVVGAIGRGLLVYVGVARTDTEAEAAWLADKLAGIRLFPGDTAEGARSMERSVLDAGGAVLLVSQFTLLADTGKGRRPSFFDAAPPETAVPLLDALAAALQARGIEVATGRFGAHMQVRSENDGPVTIVLDSTG
ncbi:MAG: D-tyrosyl-tRNA(Tyr) deacylase [Dehalococcoidia bacterium]|nr:D-tyrosyl-tRNA(Tyr) deacylase [Dehalococcoidia bacterium]